MWGCNKLSTHLSYSWKFVSLSNRSDGIPELYAFPMSVGQVLERRVSHDKGITIGLVEGSRDDT